ncbi:MAG: M23 family metallopeptidase [Deltaproteobacteria bacterium]|nr:M23 family metallopeptidase [Deltaproteobacteria bacterium]MDL1961558.1 M23 family metallopeptidase [Deltaproteobacteria bacterium]
MKQKLLSCLLIFFTTYFFLIWGICLKVEAGSYPVSVSMEPEKIPLGGIALATIKINNEIKLLDVKFLGEKIPYHLDPSIQDCFVLIGAGLDCEPGTHILTIKWQGPDGPDLYSHEVRVTARSFPEERLSVSERMVEFSPKILERVLNDQKAVKETCNKISNKLYWQRPFIWPVNSKILSPFGLRRIFNNKPRSPHSGVDLRAPEGTPILASNYGKVAMARDCYLSGKTVILDHGGGLYTLYAHLVSYEVREGQEVKRGQVVGLAGSTGRATGPHLHWGVSLIGKRLDPAELMALLGT